MMKMGYELENDNWDEYRSDELEIMDAFNHNVDEEE